MNRTLILAAVSLIALSALGTPPIQRWNHLIQDEALRHLTAILPVDSIGLNRKSNVFHFHRSDLGETAIWNAGDLRFLALDTDSFADLSYSDNNGWNYGAFPFFQNGQFHLLGGYGYWEEHFHDIVFLESRNEWERVTGDGPLHGQIPFLSNRMFETGHDSIAYLDWRVSAENPNETSYLWTRPKGSNHWEARRRIPALTSPGTIKSCFDLAEYVVMGQQTGAVLLIRKSDWHFQVLIENEGWVEMMLATDREYLAIFEEVIQLKDMQGKTYTIALEALLESAAASNWTPLGVAIDDDSMLDAGIQTGDEKSTTTRSWRSNPWLILAIGIGIGLSVAVWRGRWRRSRRERHPLMTVKDLDLSPALLAVLTKSENVISIPEFDRIMPTHPDLTPEGLRSRRARFFKELNEESESVFGFPILLRQRSASDSRMYEYHRNPLPKWIDIG